MRPSATSNSALDRLTDGASTVIPSRIASRRYSAILSVLPVASAIDAARNSAGYFAFGTDRLIAPQGTQSQAEAPPPPAEEKNGKGGQGGNGGDPPHDNPFIQGLLSKLPPEDAVWSTDQRKKWLQLAISVFEVSYKTAENDTGELSVTLTKTSAN